MCSCGAGDHGHPLHSKDKQVILIQAIFKIIKTVNSVNLRHESFIDSYANSTLCSKCLLFDSSFSLGEGLFLSLSKHKTIDMNLPFLYCE